MILREKKAVMGKILSTPIVLILIVLIMGVYLILAGSISIIKKPSVAAAFDGFYLSSDDVLFKEILIDGEKMSLAHGLIKADINERRCNIIKLRLEGDLRNPIKSDDEREALRKEQIKCSNYMSKIKESLIKTLEAESLSGESCFILCQSCNIKSGFKSNQYMKINSNEKDIALKFKDGKFLGSDFNLASGEIVSEIYTQKELDERVSFSIEEIGYKRQFNIVYYYGRCLNE